MAALCYSQFNNAPQPPEEPRRALLQHLIAQKTPAMIPGPPDKVNPCPAH